jgi:glucose-1-phosphate cytidylyltransferase
MKVVILAGGMGTRLSEETELKPKPMVEVGGKPVLWHIMKLYSHYGFNEFVLLLGYKGHLIKEYFANFFLHQSDITVDVRNNKIEFHKSASEPWKITLLDTGLDAMTGARIRKAQKYIGDETFMLTYGDGVADINIPELLNFHKGHKKAITVTAVRPEGRFGALKIAGNGQVVQFREKVEGDEGWINGGFFVCEPAVFQSIGEGEDIFFERTPLEKLARDKELFAFKHHGFWQCIDTLRDKNYLNDLWNKDQAKWKMWK